MLDIKALLTKLVDHYNNVGKVETGSGTVSSVASGTSLITLGTISGLSKGVWLCTGFVGYGGYSSGYRIAQLAYTPSGGSIINKGSSRISIPSPGNTYGIWMCSFCAIECDTTFNLHIRTAQNKGSAAADVDWTLRAVKIK